MNPFDNTIEISNKALVTHTMLNNRSNIYVNIRIIHIKFFLNKYPLHIEICITRTYLKIFVCETCIYKLIILEKCNFIISKYFVQVTSESATLSK